jgi:hypothetical protein
MPPPQQYAQYQQGQVQLGPGQQVQIGPDGVPVIATGNPIQSVQNGTGPGGAPFGGMMGPPPVTYVQDGRQYSAPPPPQPPQQYVPQGIPASLAHHHQHPHSHHHPSSHVYAVPQQQYQPQGPPQQQQQQQQQMSMSMSMPPPNVPITMAQMSAAAAGSGQGPPDVQSLVYQANLQAQQQAQQAAYNNGPSQVQGRASYGYQ